MIYFNHSATSFPKPKSVNDIISQHLQSFPSDNSRGCLGYHSTVEVAREKVASFFNAKSSERVIFTSGATEALNLSIFGLKAPKHIISSTLEHNSVIRPLKLLEKENGIRITWIEPNADGFISPADLKKNISDQTTAIVLTHCSNVTGAIQDIDSFAQISRSYQIPLIIDGSQSAGAIEIDLQKTPLDYFIFTGHKSLYGTTGVGGLILNNEEFALNPLKVGGTGVYSNELSQPKELPIYYEAGTLNTLGIAALWKGIEYIEEIGFEIIKNKKQEVFEAILGGLEAMPQIKVYGNPRLEDQLPIINFSIEGQSIDDTAYILSESFDIITRYGLHCAPLAHRHIGSEPTGTIRLGISHFNTVEEAETLIKAIHQIIKHLQQ